MPPYAKWLALAVIVFLALMLIFNGNCGYNGC